MMPTTIPVFEWSPDHGGAVLELAGYQELIFWIAEMDRLANFIPEPTVH
jgi:hypothetical protein